MCICFLRDNLFFLEGEGVGVLVRYFCLQDLGLEGTEHRARGATSRICRSSTDTRRNSAGFLSPLE